MPRTAAGPVSVVRQGAQGACEQHEVRCGYLANSQKSAVSSRTRAHRVSAWYRVGSGAHAETGGKIVGAPTTARTHLTTSPDSAHAGALRTRAARTTPPLVRTPPT